MTKIYVCDIQWDTDGDKETLKVLPTKYTFQFDISEDEIDDDFVSDYISDLTGYCHFGFEYEIIK